MTECPDCESEDTEWLNIVGDAAQPTGSIYRCRDCGTEFDDLPDGPAWKYTDERI